MADFNWAMNVIFKHEGGLADNPHDKGGITNFGITIGFLKTDELCQKYFGHPLPVTRDDIRNMSKDLAQQIYKNEIWDYNRYGEISDNKIATKVFDCTVNMGEGWGETFAQQAANRCGQSLAVDGQVGPKSIAGINACNPDQFLKEYCQQQKERYEHIVLKDPSQSIFLKTWLARAMWPLNGD
jgi:type VI secretion system secreted protein VgrG